MIERAKTISLFLVIGFLANLLVSWLKSDFIYNFLSENLITLLIALVAINTTTLGVVLSKVREIADKTGGSFERTAKEMKLSIVEQVILIIVAIIVQVVGTSELLVSQMQLLVFISNMILIAILFYAIYILYDTANSIFVILQFENSKPDKIKENQNQHQKDTRIKGDIENKKI
jgi:hypothetical protein